jgi:hypothetical protein
MASSSGNPATDEGLLLTLTGGSDLNRELEFQLALPFHDHEPRDATVSRLAVIVAGLRLRLIEERER